MTLGDRPHVLLVEDDVAARDDLRRHLEDDAYDVTVAADGAAGLAAARDLEPDLIVLGVHLTGMDGLQVCEHLRVDDGSGVPIIMLTPSTGSSGSAGAAGGIAALTSGADDYVTTPFSVAELTMRVGSVLRRSLVPAGPRPVAGLLVDGDLALNPVSREAMRDGVPLPMTTREFDLLHFFLRHPRRAFRREHLLHQVWGWEYRDHSTVSVHVERVRAAVEPEPASPRRLVTVADVGYRWDPTA